MSKNKSAKRTTHVLVFDSWGKALSWQLFVKFWIQMMEYKNLGFSSFLVWKCVCVTKKGRLVSYKTKLLNVTDSNQVRFFWGWACWHKSNFFLTHISLPCLWTYLPCMKTTKTFQVALLKVIVGAFFFFRTWAHSSTSQKVSWAWEKKSVTWHQFFPSSSLFQFKMMKIHLSLRLLQKKHLG